MKLDTKTMETKLVGPSLGGQGNKFYAGVQLQDQKIYMVPYNADSTVCFYPKSEQIDYIGNFHGEKKWAFPTLTSNSILCAPHNASQFIHVEVDKFDGLWNVFVSHCTEDDSEDVYRVVSAFMEAKDLKVFNPTSDLAHYGKINAESMQDAVKESNIVVAALSHGFFDSEWCKKEIEAARDNDIKVIPVYSGDDHGAKQIDKWVKAFRNDSSFKYIFKENARDVLNKHNKVSTKRTLQYLAKLAKFVK